MYFIGFFIMTIGIALSVKSNLGISPVSSIPYTITCVWEIELEKNLPKVFTHIKNPDKIQFQNMYRFYLDFLISYI